MADDTNNQRSSALLIKAWETMQSLAKGNGESAWKIKAWGVTTWSALMAYAYTSKTKEIILVSIALLIVSLLIEVIIRQIQYKFIERSLEIEQSLNDILAGEDPRTPKNGVSTNVDTPSLRDFLNLLSLRRWLIWLPTLILIFFSIVAFHFM